MMAMGVVTAVRSRWVLLVQILLLSPLVVDAFYLLPRPPIILNQQVHDGVLGRRRRTTTTFVFAKNNNKATTTASTAITTLLRSASSSSSSSNENPSDGRSTTATATATVDDDDNNTKTKQQQEDSPFFDWYQSWLNPVRASSSSSSSSVNDKNPTPSSSSSADGSTTAAVVNEGDNDETTTKEEEDSDSSSESSSSESSFDWYRSWYPLVPVDILDDNVPHPFQVLGMDLVVWKDAPLEGSPHFGPRKPKGGLLLGLLSGRRKRRVDDDEKRNNKGKWRAFEDACPHRKVPLSQGRIENDGTLLCSYHAWRFNGQGNLVDVPQLNTTTTRSDGSSTSTTSQPNKPSTKFQLLDRLQSNPKARCNAFPTQVVDGLLWVWPQSGDDARIEAMLTPLPINKPQQQADDDNNDNDSIIVADERKFVQKWDFRELPYGADYFVENVVDPAHVPVR